MHGENYKGTSEYRVKWVDSKNMTPPNPCSLPPEATFIARFLQILPEIFYSSKRIYIFLYFQRIGNILTLLILLAL